MKTYAQRLIQRVVTELADGRQVRAAELLGVTQASVSRFLSGDLKPRGPILLLAKLLIDNH